MRSRKPKGPSRPWLRYYWLFVDEDDEGPLYDRPDWGIPGVMNEAGSRILTYAERRTHAGDSSL